MFVVMMGDRVKIKKLYDPHKTSERATIFDRNGVIVATDLKTKSLYVSSILIKDPITMAESLGRIFSNLPAEEILKKITDNKGSKKTLKNWILIKRNLAPSQVELVKSLKMAGLLFMDDSIRVYPQKSITSHFVGYVDLDRKGLSGIEMQYDKKLVNGEDITLAMDIRVQDILHDELLNGLEEYHAKAAAGIVMDVNSGEILALSSLPEFDPNLQHNATPDERFNRVTNGIYELGSVFKIFTNAAAFENNLLNLDDSYNVKDPIKYDRFTISDDHPFRDEMNIKEIFAHSSNIGTVKIADKLGIKAQKDFLEKIGLLRKVETEFPGLGKPIYPKTWRQINLYTISYGHGIAITPLHLAMAVLPIVNGGTAYSPSFLKLDKRPSGAKILKESTSETMRIMLRNVVVEGTGRNANVEGYEIGGKTGTAERAESGSYNERQTMTSFVAIFPISKPQYLAYIMFDRPNSAFNTGGMVAAPVAGKIVKNIAPLLGVRPISNEPD